MASSLLLGERRKLVVVGDGMCGKTCLLTVYSKQKFPEFYIPTVFENCTTNLAVDGTPVELSLWDTAGQEDYNRIRPLTYTDCHVVLICFAVDMRDSFEHVELQWVTEVIHHANHAPYILVGCKTDLRNYAETVADTKSGRCRTDVTYFEGITMAQAIGAYTYLECSALTGAGVNAVFDAAARVALEVGQEKKKRRTCHLL